MEHLLPLYHSRCCISRQPWPRHYHRALSCISEWVGFIAQPFAWFFLLSLDLSHLHQQLLAPPNSCAGQAFPEGGHGCAHAALLQSTNNEFVSLSRLNCSLDGQQSLPNGSCVALTQESVDEVVWQLMQCVHGALENRCGFDISGGPCNGMNVVTGVLKTDAT